MSKNIVETIVGAVVLLVAGWFLVTAYQGGRVKDIDGYALNATFERVDGLSIGSDVRISGLSIGKVVANELDAESYEAKVQFQVAENVKIPSDSTAEIISNGLLGDKYLAIVPGGSDEYLSDGGKISFTQSSISIESLIGKFVFGGADGEKDDKSKGSEKSEDDIF